MKKLLSSILVFFLFFTNTIFSEQKIENKKLNKVI